MSNSDDNFINEVKNHDILVRYSIKAFLVKIIPAVMITTYILVLWNAIPAKGLKVAHLFILAPLSFPPLMAVLGLLVILALNKVFLKNKTPILIIISLILGLLGFLYLQMPTYAISKSTLNLVMLSLASSFMLQPLYFIFFAKTGFISANKRKIEINEGVFNRIKDPTDLVMIDDCNEERPFIYRILGLSKLEIILKKGKDNVINLNFLNKKDASNLYDFIQAHAFSNSTEYWTTRDRNKNRGKDMKYIDDMGNDGEDDDGEEIEPQE